MRDPPHSWIENLDDPDRIAADARASFSRGNHASGFKHSVRGATICKDLQDWDRAIQFGSYAILHARTLGRIDLIAKLLDGFVYRSLLELYKKRELKRVQPCTRALLAHEIMACFLEHGRPDTYVEYHPVIGKYLVIAVPGPNCDILRERADRHLAMGLMQFNRDSALRASAALRMTSVSPAYRLRKSNLAVIDLALADPRTNSELSEKLIDLWSNYLEGIDSKLRIGESLSDITRWSAAHINAEIGRCLHLMAKKEVSAEFLHRAHLLFQNYKIPPSAALNNALLFQNQERFEDHPDRRLQPRTPTDLADFIRPARNVLTFLNAVPVNGYAA